MTKIVVLAGRKQSGKSSTAKFLCGYAMRQAGRLKYFDVDDLGVLSGNTLYTDADGNQHEAPGVLDIYRRDYEFIRYALGNIWPHVKVYSFADRLKQTLEIVFSIPHENLCGADEEKNMQSHLKWEDMPGYTGPKTGYMTFREVAQYFGTEVCRKMMDNCWIQACYTDILADESPIAVVDDARFPNEVMFMKNKGAKVIKLARSPNKEDTHTSETALDSLGDTVFDAVIYNEGMTMKEKNEAVLNECLRLGVFA